MRKLLAFVMVFFAGAVIAGCGGGTTQGPEVTEITTGTVGDANATGLGGADDTSGQDFEQIGSADADPLDQRVIYFNYDSSILTLKGEAVVRAHAGYLNGAPDVQIILEGHADERGTREYNLALAEDRAKSAANLMQALGVGSGRIQTISYGEERPIALGHDESAWGMNRRVEILYQ